MSSLQRYKKSGGFFQLLSLIETFGPQKKEKFLEMIDQESKVWAQALRDKMLTLERIFSWPDQVVSEVFKRLPRKNQAFAMAGLKDEYKAKINQFVSASDNRRMQDVLSESRPKPEEIQATLVKMVELARKMINDKELMPDKFDQGLVIPESFEARLEDQHETQILHGKVDDGSPEIPVINLPPSPSAGDGEAKASGTSPADLANIHRALATLAKENKSLKEEVKSLREKLDAVRKIAA